MVSKQKLKLLKTNLTDVVVIRRRVKPVSDFHGGLAVKRLVKLV